MTRTSGPRRLRPDTSRGRAHEAPLDCYRGVSIKVVFSGPVGTTGETNDPQTSRNIVDVGHLSRPRRLAPFINDGGPVYPQQDTGQPLVQYAPTNTSSAWP